MQAVRREALAHTTLALGDVATIDSQSYTLIGLMRCRTPPAPANGRNTCSSARRRLLWLVESATGWQKVKVFDVPGPSMSRPARCAMPTPPYTGCWQLHRRSHFAAGAFNWQVKVGDTVAITEYRGSRGTLSSERTPAEITWSLAQRVPAGTVDGWFGKRANWRSAAAGDRGGAGNVAPASAGPARQAIHGHPVAHQRAAGFHGRLRRLADYRPAVGVLWLPLFSRCRATPMTRWAISSSRCWS